NTISGTSMATPHTAGVAALYLEANPGATPADVSTGLKAVASQNKISNVPGSTVNLLLYSVFGPPPPPPSAPTLSSPSDAAVSVPVSGTLSWNAASGASTYGIQVSTASDFSTLLVNASGIGSTSYNVSGLAGNTVYYWRVRATNAGGTSSWSSVWSFTTAQPVALSAPVLNAPGDGLTGFGTKVSFTWFSVSGAATYNMQISTNSGFTSLFVNRSGLTSTGVTISNLKRNTVYYWRVRAVDASGTNTSGWSSVRSFKTGL
ncbi:MAG: hypothetical protein RL732_593, partial [Bacteroidota bacterium]